MQKLAAALVLVLASAPALPVAATGTAGAKAAGAQVNETGAIEADAGGKAGARGKAPIPGGPNDANALWWNDPGIIEVLSLTEGQRKKMTGYLDAYRKDLPEERRPAAFHEALVQGDWKAARTENAKLSQLAERAVRTRGDLKIDVLSQLSAEQHQILVDRYPQLIYKPWMRAMRGARR